jgi:hypothetical protein
MVLAVSLIGALLLLAYCFVWRFKAKREVKKRSGSEKTAV